MSFFLNNSYVDPTGFFCGGKQFFIKRGWCPLSPQKNRKNKTLKRKPEHKEQQQKTNTTTTTTKKKQ
jgi:hypothetical protein